VWNLHILTHTYLDTTDIGRPLNDYRWGLIRGDATSTIPIHRKDTGHVPKGTSLLVWSHGMDLVDIVILVNTDGTNEYITGVG